MFCIDSMLKRFAASRKRRLSALPNVGPYIYIYIYIYTTLKFLALQGAPYIYDISRLRVKDPLSCIMDGNWYRELPPQECERDRESVRDFQREQMHKRSHCGCASFTYKLCLPHLGCGRDEQRPYMVTSK
jgi:hypothetical protein